MLIKVLTKISCRNIFVPSVMQDDFGEFLQAPSVPSTSHMQRNAKQGTNTPKDLNSKIMESFDLSGSNQKASFNFQQPVKQVGRRPQHTYAQSTNSADWKNLDLKTSEFTAPIRSAFQHHHPRHHHVPQQAKTPQFNQNIMNQSQLSTPAYGANSQMVSQSQYMPYMQNGARYAPPQGNKYGSPQLGTFQHDRSLNNQSTAFPHAPNFNSGVSGVTVVSQQSPYGNYHATPHQQPSGSFFNSAVSGNSTVNPPVSGYLQPSAAQAQNTQIYSSVGPSSQSVPNFQETMKSLYSQPARSPDTVTLPSWMTNPNQIPPLYKHVLKLCATPNSFADTARLYPIFVSSQLPKDVLGHIWSTANLSSPGQLTFSEVYIALALIALAQKGEMNLTVSYVTKLKAAPIPNLQLAYTETRFISPSEQPISVFPSRPQTNVNPSSQIGNLLPVAQNSAIGLPTKTTNFENEDDFSDFQSVPAALPSFQEPTSKPAINNDVFQDFKSFTSSKSDTVPTYPDRSTINSPKSSLSEKDSGQVNSPKPLLGGIDFNKFKSDASKSLHSAARSLNIAPKVYSATPKTADRIEFNEKTTPSTVPQLDDFGDFKSASIVESSVKAPIRPDNIVPIVPSFSSSISFESAMPAARLSSTTANTSSLMDMNSSIDKYSALRDIMPSITPPKLDHVEEEEEEVDFAEFQTASATFEKTTSDPDIKFSNTSENKIAFAASTSSPSLRLQVEDTQSITSLELPSLSKTISNLSIGSSPSRGNEDLYSLTIEDKNSTGDFGNFTTFASEVPPVMPTPQQKIKTPETDFGAFSTFQHNMGSSFVPTTQHHTDGLYSLDAPISPPSNKKDKENSKYDKPMSPPKVKRFVVPRRISEADSDFGDFSAGPPPIDDNMDHGDFDHQEGDSSLVDFDAFGHLEEAKLERLKQKEAEFKRNKEDATAFSEFVKSSVINIKPTHDNNDASNMDNEVSNGAEEDWSGFNGSDGEMKSDTWAQQLSPDEDNRQLKVEMDIGEKTTTWKLESTISESDFENISESEINKYDEEGEELKARMEGTTSSNPMELYVDHWTRCLATCKDIIVSTGDIFAALNSPSVCHEIVNSTRGKEFISCTSEVYGVARRIRKGMESVGLMDDDLEMTSKEIEIAWNNLLGFCPYTPSVHKTPEHCASASNGSERKNMNSACSLCLLSTTGTSPVGLEYGGKSYHAPCANLWLNQIAPILPRLELPGAF